MTRPLKVGAMSPDERVAARARCAAATDDIEMLARLDLTAALDALDAADRRIAELAALVLKLAERVHSQSEKLGRRAEKRPKQ
jgi:hypothetical protein